MKKVIYIISVYILISGAGDSQYGWAGEKVDADMYASVIVNPVFGLSLDNADIGFGYTDPGTSTELKKDTYYNSVTCNVNKGETWYLKISIIGSEVSGPSQIPVESFKWKIFRSTGDGAYDDQWHPFTSKPMAAYTSGSNDNTGGDVTVQFRYRLDLPGDAAGGYYSVKVMYTATDVP